MGSGKRSAVNKGFPFSQNADDSKLEKRDPGTNNQKTRKGPKEERVRGSGGGGAGLTKKHEVTAQDCCWHSYMESLLIFPEWLCHNMAKFRRGGEARLSPPRPRGTAKWGGNFILKWRTELKSLC